MISVLRAKVLLAAILLLLLPLVACSGEGGNTSETPGGGNGASAQEDRTGVTNTEILLGGTFPLSNSPAAAYAPMADAIRAYFNYVNDQGGVNGRTIKWLVEDDQFNPAITTEAVRKLVEQDKVFAMAGSLGDPGIAATMDYLDERGVPNLFLAANDRRLTDPVVPTLFECSADQLTQEKSLTQYIADNYSGKKLGLLAVNDDSGKLLADYVREGLAEYDIEVDIEYFDATQFDVTAQTQRLRNANPDVVALAANPLVAASALKVAREVLTWDVPMILSASGTTETTLALAGSANAEGAVGIHYLKQITDDDPAIERHKELMAKYAPDVTVSTNTVYGQMLAELVVQALKNAGPDLTREAVIRGAEQIRDFCCSVCLSPANLSKEDHRPSETMHLFRVEGGKWVAFGDPISFESSPGQLKTCNGGG